MRDTSSYGLFDAVVCREDWPKALQAAAETLDAQGITLIPDDIETVSLGMMSSSKIHEACERYLNEGWYLHDFRRERLPPLRGDRFVFETDISSEGERRTHPYYQEFLRPHGLLWWAASAMSIAGKTWYLTVQRSIKQGPFGPHDIDGLRSVRARIGDAISLALKVSRATAEGQLDVFERLDCAAILVDSSGMVLGTNSGADRLLGKGLSLRGRRLVAGKKASDDRLQALLARTRLDGAFSGRASHSILVECGDARPLLVRAMVLGGRLQDLFASGQILLLLEEVGKTAPPSPILLRQAFGLTPAELRLATELVGGASLDQICERFEVSKNTVRGQLKSLMAKTGTNRQAQLAVLLSSFKG